MSTDGMASRTSGTVTTHGLSRSPARVWASIRSSPWKVMKKRRKLYSAVMKTPNRTAQYAYPAPKRSDSLTERMMASFEKKPEKNGVPISASVRSEEHTSELQSRGHLVCRL